MNLGNIAGLVSAPLKTKGVNYVLNNVTLNSPLTWSPVSLNTKPITQIIGTIYSNLTISIPSITKAATICKSISFTAGANFDYSTGNEYGGNILINAGKAYRGGTVRIAGGDGPYSGEVGEGAVVQASGANGGQGGTLYLSGGGAQNSAGNNGGDVVINTAAARWLGAPTFPGNVYISTGNGNPANQVNNWQSTGGVIRIVTGNGGNTVNPTTNGGGSTGAAGGNLILSGGFGGNSTGVVSTAQTGGSGASVSIFSGNGGTAIVATSSGTRTGGNSGIISIITGAGGNGITINGNSGSLILGTGIPGNYALSGAAVGTAGSINLNPGTTNVLTISSTAIRATQPLNLENGTTANSMFVYNTYTNATNFERGFLKWNSNVFQLGTDELGTGLGRSLDIQTDGTTRMSVAAAGNVGINTSTPNERLTVVGNISASGIIYGNGSGLTNLPSSGSGGAYLPLSGGTLTGGLTVVGNISAAGDIEVATYLQGIILVSPNLSRWRITVNDDGSLQTAAI